MLQAQTQRDTLQRNSIFLFNSKRESQAKKILTAFHKWIWFQQPFGAARIQTTNRPLGFCPCHVPFLPTGEVPLPLGSPPWRKDRASPTFLLYSSANHPLPPVSFTAPTAGPAQRPGRSQSTTGLDFVVHFGGPALQACIAIKYPLFLRVITYSSHLRNTPSRMSPDSLSTNNCCAPAVYSSIGNTVAPNIRLFQGQYVYILCSLSCSLWYYLNRKKKKLEITQLLNHKGMVKQNIVFPLDRILPGH